MAEHFGFNFAVSFVCLECTDNEIVRVVGATSHLGLEHGDHGIKGASTSNFSQHIIQFTFSHEFTNIVKSSTDIVLGDGAIFVNVHLLKALLVHAELLLGE